ncbi:MAG: protocatechuate 3,4-dioxygenase subunit alpha [Terracidiphilus sp.]
MTARLIPSGSQTVGPFFHIGLDHLIDRQQANASAAGSIVLSGRVIEGNGAPVSDAMLEFWGADASGRYPDPAQPPNDLPSGFRRAVTDSEGRFSISIGKPGPVPLGDGQFQSPHFLVLVFARGLLRHLITRVYFGDERGNESDPVLLQIPADRRQTLVACAAPAEAGQYHWDVVLQGESETAFFAW